MTASLMAWLVATVGHFLLTHRAIARTSAGRNATVDERAWMSVLASVGALSGVLHVLAVTTGVSLVSGLIALTLWHLLLAALNRSRDTVPGPRTTFSWPELLAIACLFAVLFSWLDVAARSAAVQGSDAAHYHVPNALNVALGASLFDLPATQHLYPMAGSVVVAWFILPTGTPLVIDLAMVLAWLLAAASVNWMFRLCTGLSGLAWASWLTLALFSTPLFRATSQVSADLWFTAGFMALMAALTGTWSRRAWRPIDLALAGAALGLLLGSKTTGVAAAALLLGVYGAAELVRGLAIRQWPALPQRLFLHGAIAAGFAVASGGIWLIRNWVSFGSPIAPTGFTILGLSIFPGEPLEPTTYLSVLGDVQEDPAYDIGARTIRYARIWLGGLFLRSLAPALFVPLDLVVARRRDVWTPQASTRTLVVLLAVIPGVALIWLLIGAPWTSLEWTRGFSLRYALPVLMAASLVAAIGLFPVSWRWYDNRTAASMALVIIVAAAGALFWTSMHVDGLRFTPVPRADPVWVVAGAAIALLCWRIVDASRTTKTFASLLILVLTTAWWIPTTAARHHNEQVRANERLAHERAAAPETIKPSRLPYLAALEAEAASNRQCATRRFFILSRFDLPLELEGPDFRNLVFYAARDVDATARAGPVGPCDYVVATEDIFGTDKGRALLTALSGDEPLRQILMNNTFLLFGRP